MAFMPLKLLALIPFWIAVIIHLIFCCKEDEKKRAITKLTLMPALGIYILVVDAKATFLFLAVFLAYLGDIFLLYKNNKGAFFAGFIAFGLSHITYMVLLLSKIGWNNLPSWPYLVFIPIGLIIGSFLFIHYVFKDSPGPFKPIMVAYSFLLTLELAIAIYLTINDFQVFSLLMIGGNLLFITSDTYIGITTFLSPRRRSHFLVMLTYTLAQLLIVVAILHL